MGLEVAGLHAGGFPRVCVFHLHSEGVALLLGALEINPVCPRGHMRKAVLSAYTASQKVASSELLPLGPKALEEGRLVLYSLQDKWEVDPSLPPRVGVEMKALLMKTA